MCSLSGFCTIPASPDYSLQLGNDYCLTPMRWPFHWSEMCGHIGAGGCENTNASAIVELAICSTKLIVI